MDSLTATSSSSTSAISQVARQLASDRPSSAGMISLQRELEFTKAELEREQAKRRLDRQHAEQVCCLCLVPLLVAVESHLISKN